MRQINNIVICHEGVTGYTTLTGSPAIHILSEGMIHSSVLHGINVLHQEGVYYILRIKKNTFLLARKVSASRQKVESIYQNLRYAYRQNNCSI